MPKKKDKKKSTPKDTITIKSEWIVAGVLFLLLVVSVVTSGFTNLPFNLKSPFGGGVLGKTVLSEEEIKTRVTDYINNELLQGQGTAEITEVTEDEESSDLYKITIRISDQDYESFVSKDGKYLYTERLEVTLADEVAEYPKQDVPDVLFFTMSYCPYGNQAEDFVQPVYDLLKDNANFEPHYVIYSSAQGYEGAEYCLDDENKYCSMHGVQELNQGVRELCTFKYQKDKFWDFVLAANEECDSDNVDECWEQVAQNVGIDVDQIKSCQANEAYDLLTKEVELNDQYSVTGSPTILVNGQTYEGERSAESFKQAICAAFNNEPDGCSQTLDDTGSSSSGSCD